MDSLPLPSFKNKYFPSKAEKVFVYALMALEICLVFFLAPYSGDYDNYKKLIEDVYPNLDFLLLLGSDPLFSFTTLILSYMGMSFSNVLFFIALFSLVMKNFIFLRYNFSVYISILYFSSLFWMHELIQIRTALATTFILIAWEFYRANNSRVYILSLFLAIASHLSAIVFLLLHFVRRLNLNYLLCSFVLLSITLLIFGNLLFDQLISFNIDRIVRYYDTDLSSDKVGVFTVLNLIVVFQIFIFFLKMNRYTIDKLNRLLIPSPFLVLIFLIIGQYMPVLSIRPSQILFLPVLMLFCVYLTARSVYYRTILMMIFIPLLLYAFPYKNFFMDF
jgi:hypothetical protein